MRRLWELAAAARAIEFEFVEAVQRLVLQQTPPLDPDAAAMSQSLAAMRTLLARWDDALQQLRAAAAPHLRVAETHVAFGTASLNRQFGEHMLKPLVEASRIEPNRADIHALLADGMRGNPPGAVDEWRRAADLDDRNAAYAYRLAHTLRRLGRDEEAKRALQRVVRLRSAVPVPDARTSVRR